MKRHISIFTFLLFVFAAGVASETGAATEQTVYGGYCYTGMQYRSDLRDKHMKVNGSYMPVKLSAAGDKAVCTATKPDGMRIADKGWGYVKSEDSSATLEIMEFDNVTWDAKSSSEYEWPYDGKSLAYVAIAVRFDYIKYNVTYNENGGSPKPQGVVNQSYDTDFTLAAAPAKTGYTFNGWETSTNGESFEAGASINGERLGLADCHVDGSNVTMKAQWTTNAYSVGCGLNGGAWPADYEPPVRAAYDTAFSLPAPTRTGYDFIGWKVTSGLDTTTAKWGTDKNPSTPITADTLCVNGANAVYFKNINPTDNAAVTLTAQWKAKEITVTLTTPGATSAEKEAKVFYDKEDYGQIIVPVIPGFDFCGYEIDGRIYWDSKGMPAQPKWDIPTNCTAVAKLAESTYYLTYDENRSDGVPSRQIVTNFEYNVAVKLYDGAGFSNFGCTLLGWSTGSGATEPTYELGGSVAFKKDTTLYAVWEKNYFIAYDGNGATNETPMAVQKLVFGKQGQSLDPNAYGKTGYTFLGWATNRVAALELDWKYADRQVLQEGLAKTIGETNTLYATWATNTYYVAFDMNGGSDVAPDVLPCAYDNPVDLIWTKKDGSEFTNGAYDFLGWSNDVAKVIYTNREESVSNLCATAKGTNTLYAVWKLSDLSAAMHCDNLRWFANDRSDMEPPLEVPPDNPWRAIRGDGVGDGTDSCVRQTGARLANQMWLVAQVPEDGTISFRWKPTDVDGKLIFWVNMDKNDSEDDTAQELMATPGQWSGFRLDDMPSGSWIHLYFWSSTGTCDIDQMTWIPEGPTPEPEPVITNAVPVAITGLVYDGTAKTGVAAGANYTIIGNVATNAGDYVATATVTNGVWEGGATGATNIAWTIAKATYDMGGVTFASATYEHDGKSHSIAVAGVPSGVEVVYTGDATNRTEVGTNTVTASFKVLDGLNYNAITTQMTATLAITAKEEPPKPLEPVVTNAVPVAITGLVYDGTAKTGVAAGANYTIIGNVATNAGDYVATVTVTNGVWEGGAAGATNIAWTIAKATYDMSGVTFASATYVFDGEEHSIAVAGVPSGVEVVYSGDSTNRTEVGTNTVTASFRVLDEFNYNAITTQMTATLAITAKEEPPEPPDPTVAYENIYFKATLAELGAEAVPTNRKITIKAEGLPKGLKLVTTALKDEKKRATGYYAHTVEGAPTETMDGLSRIAYVRVTDNKVQTLYALDLSVLWAKAYEDKSFPDGEVKSEYANFSVTNLWPDIAAHPKNWTFSGWPTGIKFTTKDVTSRKRIDGVYVTLTNALAYEIYGTPTKAGRFTVKAVEKIAGTSYKSTHVATFTVWPQGAVGDEWTNQAYVAVIRESGTGVKSASGLPTGIKFTAKDVITAKVLTAKAHTFYGTPTKAGTYAVTLTHEDKSKTQFLWTITPAAAPAFELKLTETEVDPATAKATIRQGVSYEWTVDNTLGSKVSASGLPSGLSLKSTAIKNGKTTIGYAYSVKGVPTKAGEYFVTFKTTMNGVTTVTTAAFTVLDLPAWAQGTFNGGADGSFPSGGQANLTLSKVGKLSGKWMSEGTNWTLSAASYDRYDPKSGSYVTLMIGKTGSGKKAVSFTNELFVSKANAEYLGGVATNALFIVYQNVWKTEPWKTIGKKFTKGGTVVLHPGVVGTNDTITLKFAASGTVTVAGKFEKSVDSKGKVSYYSVSASAVLCPQEDPDEYGAFDGVVFVYFPPKAKTPLSGGYSACVWVRWDGSAFAERPPASDE